MTSSNIRVRLQHLVAISYGALSKIESVQRTFTKRIRNVRGLSYAERLSALVLESLEIRRVRLDLISLYVYMILFGKVDIEWSNICFNSRPCLYCALTHCYKHFFKRRGVGTGRQGGRSPPPPNVEVGGSKLYFRPPPPFFSHSKLSVIDKVNLNVDLNCNLLYLGSCFQLYLNRSLPQLCGTITNLNTSFYILYKNIWQRHVICVCFHWSARHQSDPKGEEKEGKGGRGQGERKQFLTMKPFR